MAHLKRHILILLAALALCLPTFFASRTPVRADDSSMVHAVRLVSPAVVRIVTVVSGHVTCHGCNSDGSDLVFPLDGSSYGEAFTGSGAFVSPDGYILTADHVVDIDHSSVDQDFLNDAINEYAQQQGISVSDATQDFNNSLSSISVDHNVDSQRAYLSTAYTGGLQNTAQVTSYAVTRIVANSTPDKQDVAIIKVEAHDMPFLTLAAANSISVQDTVTAVAFPADADTGDFTALVNPSQSDINSINSLLSSSVNSGQITAQKTWADGTLVYEVNGIANHGSSGGPVIDAHGAIIGFVDAISGDNARLTYVVPSDVISEYTKQAGIDNSGKGAFMALWTKAVTEYDTTGTCRYTNSAKDLKALRDTYPGFGAVAPLLSDAQAKANATDCPPPSNAGGVVMTILLLLILAGAGVGGYFFLKKQKAAQPAVAGAAPYTYVAPGTQPAPPQLTVVAGTAMTAPAAPELSPAPSPVAALAKRICANGHEVADTTAQFCPQCGGAVHDA